ncbi:hypothetical protein [Streptomyces sp. NPDC051572]|uniref:hypothetical protein n=1 Tax=Streptomyces sp. NPDC051572 TaxID=3155802 RepID=UPI00344C11AA
MAEDEGTPHGEATPPVPHLDPAMFTAGGPGKTVAVASDEFTEQLRARVGAEGGMLLPGGTREEADMARASLAALKGWAARRDRLPEQRADLLATAWWSGWRNVAELARTADVSRDTVYDDLRARGIEPTNRIAVAERPRPRYEPLRADAVHELSELAAQVLLLAQLVEEPVPLARAAWQMSTAYDRIAVLLDENDSGRHVEMAEDLASKLRDALRHAHAHWASLLSTDQLAARTFERDLDLLDSQAVAGGATLQLSLPIGRTITVTLGAEDFRSSKEGWTTVRSDSELLDSTISGADHVAIKDALDTIAEVLTAHLREDAFETD